MKDKVDHEGSERLLQARTLLDALAAADIKRLVHASADAGEADEDRVEQIRRRYVDE